MGDEPDTLEACFQMWNANYAFYKDKIKKTLRLLKGMKKEQKYILICFGHTGKTSHLFPQPRIICRALGWEQINRHQEPHSPEITNTVSAGGELGNDLGKLFDKGKESPEDWEADEQR